MLLLAGTSLASLPPATSTYVYCGRLLPAATLMDLPSPLEAAAGVQVLCHQQL